MSAYMTSLWPTSIHYYCYTGYSTWWKLFIATVCLFSTSDFLHWLCARISFLRKSSVSVYIRFCIPVTSISASVEFNRVKPPLMDISPRTAPKLIVHFFPLLVCTRGDVLMEMLWPHFTHDACQVQVPAISFKGTFPAIFCTVYSQCTDESQQCSRLDSHWVDW